MEGAVAANPIRSRVRRGIMTRLERCGTQGIERVCIVIREEYQQVAFLSTVAVTPNKPALFPIASSTRNLGPYAKTASTCPRSAVPGDHAPFPVR